MPKGDPTAAALHPSALVLHHRAFFPPRAALPSECSAHFSGSLQQLLQVLMLEQFLPHREILSKRHCPYCCNGPSLGRPFVRSCVVHSAADLDFFCHCPVKVLICFSPSLLRSWLWYPLWPQSTAAAKLQSLPRSQWELRSLESMGSLGSMETLDSMGSLGSMGVIGVSGVNGIIVLYGVIGVNGDHLGSMGSLRQWGSLCSVGSLESMRSLRQWGPLGSVRADGIIEVIEFTRIISVNGVIVINGVIGVNWVIGVNGFNGVSSCQWGHLGSLWSVGSLESMRSLRPLGHCGLWCHWSQWGHRGQWGPLGQ